MKQLYLLLLLSLLISSCGPEKKAFNTIDFKEPKKELGILRRIKISDVANKFSSINIYAANATEEGLLYDTFRINKAGIYNLDLLSARTHVYLEQGDLLKITSTGSYDDAVLHFEGEHADDNNFMFENDQVFGKNILDINDAQLLHGGEDFMVERIDKIKSATKQLEGKYSNKIIREFVQIENASSIFNLCMFYKYKVNKFSSVTIKTPAIDKLLKEFDPNNETYFEVSPMYRKTMYEYFKAAFQETHLEGPSLEKFHEFIQAKSVKTRMQDYLLSMFATNYCITDYSSEQETKIAYDYLTKKVTDEECKKYIYTAFVKATRDRR
jgi:hypothetical protein